jgi:hypothetical protein
MTRSVDIVRSFRLSSVIVMVAVLLWCTCLGSSFAATGNGNNLLLNSEFKSAGGAVPEHWKVEVLPPCGSSYAVHQANGASEFELINDKDVESAFAQTLTLEPGWYQFNMEVQTEVLGSEGAAPELFAKAVALPVQTRTHPMGWKAGWHEYQLTFKVGPSVREVSVGVSLGTWGSPNTGKVLVRNPILTAAEEPHALKGDLNDFEKYDLQRLADKRFNSPGAKEAFAPAKYPPGRFWTVAAVYLGFLMLTIFGWWAVSPGPRNP